MATPAKKIRLRIPVPVDVVFDYLADPSKRPEWQSSLRRIEPISQQTSGVGATWRDITTAGLKPVMTVTRHEPHEVWAERGTWRGVEAELTLWFEPVGEATELKVRFELSGRGVYAVPARVAGLIAPAALRSDLKRAAAIVAQRPDSPA